MEDSCKTRLMIRLWILVCLLAVLPGGLAIAAPGDITRVSVASDGMQGNEMSRWPQISDDGKHVVFESYASNLVSGDTNGEPDIFVHSRLTGVTERVSIADDESQANSWSESDLAISGDGRYVAFASMASNLVSGDTNGIMDVFVRDRKLGQTKRVSVNSAGTQASGDEWSSFGGIAISSDGRFVAFTSNVANLVSGDTNGVEDVFVHDLQTGTTRRVSVSSSGAQSNGYSLSSDISGDGHLILFESGASNLVVGDTNRVSDIFLHNMLTGETARISVSTAGEQANRFSSGGDLSDNGRFVAFSSEAENLAPDYEIWEHVYVRDLVTGETSRASVTSSGYPMVGWAEAPAISDDGRFVAFEFDDRDDGAPQRWIYVRDRATGQTIEAARGDFDGERSPFNPSLSGDGLYLAFDSGLSTLVSGDTNQARDVFVREAPFYSDPAPVVVSITRLDPNPAFTSRNVNYTVLFSEPVTGVEAGDFRLTKTGGTGAAAIGAVAGSGTTYTVSVGTGSGKGSVRLDLIDNDSIRDAANQPLGGAGAGNGNFTAGEVYNIFVLDSATFRSNGANDGWVLESGETTNRGGSINSTSKTFYLGDNAQDRQFRAVLHFATSYLPDDAVIVRAVLKLKKYSVTGTDPFTTHQNIIVDVRDGGFSGSKALQAGDFQAASSRNGVGAFRNVAMNNWTSTTLNAAAFPYISLTGVTQFRLRFKLDDNDNMGTDTLQFYSGDQGDLALRPRLEIQYYLP